MNPSLNKTNPIYEIITVEYVNALANYLNSRVSTYGVSDDRLFTILEVGAGNGRLTHFLSERFQMEFGGKVKFIATDSGRNGIQSAFPVEYISYQEALKIYEPTVVICSWMPDGTDWTSDFRANSSVREYLVIGDPEETGKAWETWGFDWMHYFRKSTEKKPFEQDDFTIHRLLDISRLQICRTDSPPHFGSSQTVSFIRVA